MRFISRLLLGTLVALVACSSAAPEGTTLPAATGTESADLLSTPCAVDIHGNVTLTIKYGEIGYLGYRTGGGAVANAVTTHGGVCLAGPTNTIAVIGQGGVPTSAEKVVLDYTLGLFGQGLTTVTLDTAPGIQSKLVVMAPTTGSNFALGTLGLDLDARAVRGNAKLDVALKWTNGAGAVVFNGGAGNDAFIADATGLTQYLPTAISSTWDTSADLAKAVGAAFAGTLTVYGGAGNDVLAGGAGMNYLFGGSGDDVFPQSSVAHAEVMSGGDGWDTVDYSVRTASQPMTATLGIDGAVTSVTVNAGGSGYVLNDVLTLVGGGAGNVTAATVKVTAVSSGAVTGLSVVSAGAGYLPETGAATTGGTGSGATINILPNGLSAVAVAAGGLLYKVGDLLTVTPASGTNATVRVATVSSSGAIGSAVVTATGSGFSMATYPYGGGGGPSTVSGGSGANASFTVTALLNSGDDGSPGEGDSIGGTDGLGDNDIEVVIGGAGNDLLDARRVLTDVVLQGGAGKDYLRGGAGRDDLCGGPGNDTFQYSGCSTSHGCATARASGDFISGSGGFGGGAGAGDTDTVEYLQSPTGVTVCLNPADTTCGGHGNPNNQIGATANMFDVINNTNMAACPSARPFLIDCNGTAVGYTPGAGTVTTSVATVAITGGHAGTNFAVGDLVSIAGGTGGHLAVAQVTTVSGTAAASLVLVNAGQGYTAGTANTANAILPSIGTGLQVDISLASVGDYTCSTSPTPHAQAAAGAAEQFDVANATGHPTLVNILDCDGNGLSVAPASCTLVGGLAADTLQGTVHTDAIYGNGNGDTVITNGGADLVDLTYSGVGVVEKLDCGNVAVTVIYHAADQLECRGVADGLGVYSDTSDQCTTAGNTCHLAYFLPD